MIERTAERISIILLAHNEAASIEEEIAAFQGEVLDRLPQSELIVAEDGSTDGTRERIEVVQRRYDNLRIVGSSERLGYATAVRNAVAHARGDFVFVCDGGLKHDPSDFWKLYDERQSADLITGRRTNRTDQRYRRFFSSALNFFVRHFFGIEAFDADSGMRLYNRRVVDEVFAGPLHFRGFISTEIVIRGVRRGFRYIEVPVSYRRTRSSSRGLPFRTIPRAVVRFLVDLWRLKRELAATGCGE
jgi:glycosyltransferase involved in cell wall biosynthesis